MKKALSITLGLILTSSLLGQQFPYQNPGLNSQERAKDLIIRLTLEEKAALMCDISDAIPRLGIKKFNWWSEALHGLANNGNVVLTIPVSNSGKRTGTEIIQVYVHKVNNTDGPLKTLKGFKRLELAAGKSVQAVINLPSASFEFFDRTSGKMAVTPGEYEIWYGNSSDARDLKMAMITIQ